MKTQFGVTMFKGHAKEVAQILYLTIWGPHIGVSEKTLEVSYGGVALNLSCCSLLKEIQGISSGGKRFNVRGRAF